MAVRPSPMIFTCTACSWKKRTHPKSDALMGGEYFDKCPKCGAGVEVKRDVTWEVLRKVQKILGYV
jgi:NAD-dependent SIR2 family protein deacetylase